MPLLALVVAWDAWMLTRPPTLPPCEEQAYALRQTAGAVAEEVLAILSAEGRLPAQAEVAHMLDEELTYQWVADGFVITNTDGEYLVVSTGQCRWSSGSRMKGIPARGHVLLV